MPIGQTSPPNVVFSTSQDLQPQLELLLFGQVAIGRKLRVVVYEEQHFIHGALTGLHQQAFSRFDGFGEQVVPKELRDPASLIEDGSNGVLLTFELQVRALVPPKAQPKHQKWGFEPITGIVACRPKKELTAIEVGVRDEDGDRMFGPVVRLPDTSLVKPLELYVVVSDASTHAIVFSNGWRSPQLIGRNLTGGPTRVSAKAPQGAAARKIGGEGMGPGGPPGEASSPITVDMTGMYEAYLSESDLKNGDAIPILSIQINQGGHAVAGWFRRPDTTFISITPRTENLRITVPAAPAALNGVDFGVLLGHVTSDVQFNWGIRSTQGDDPRPDLVDSRLSGTLTREANDSVTARFRRGADEATVFLRRIEPTPRWSNKIIDQLAARTSVDQALARSQLIGAQAEPIPNAFWNLIGRDCMDTGTLGKLIIRERTSSGNERRVARENISDYLLDLLKVDGRHRDRMISEFTAKAGGVSFAIDGHSKKPQTAYFWLNQMEKELLDEVRKDNPGIKPAELLKRADPGFVKMGIVPVHSFAYRMKLFAIGGEITVGISVGAYAAAVEITRLKVLDDGSKEPDKEVNWLNVVKKARAMFCDIGIAIGAKLKFEGSGPIAEVDFLTVHDLVPNDFDNATFDSKSGALLSAEAGVVGASGPTSAVVTLRLTHKGEDVTLVGGTNSWGEPPALDSQPFKKPDFGPELVLVSFSLGYGRFVSSTPVTPPKPGEKAQPEEKSAEAVHNIVAFFRKGSASLTGSSLAAVEEALATERALFVSGGGWARALGHTSPEGPNNQALSVKRGEALINAVKVAFVMTDSLGDVGVLGRGSQLADEEGLLRPPVPAGKESEYRRQEQETFPSFRFALLEVSGVLLLRVEAGKVGLDNELQ